MKKIKETNLDNNRNSDKFFVLKLRRTFGIGPSRANQICKELGLSIYTRMSMLSDNQLIQINKMIDQNYLTGLNLKKAIRNQIGYLKMLNCYRGKRHALKLPVRGQRTHTNARSQKLINK